MGVAASYSTQRNELHYIRGEAPQVARQQQRAHPEGVVDGDDLAVRVRPCRAEDKAPDAAKAWERGAGGESEMAAGD